MCNATDTPAHSLGAGERPLCMNHHSLASGASQRAKPAAFPDRQFRRKKQLPAAWTTSQRFEPAPRNRREGRGPGEKAAPTGNPALPVGRQPTARYDAMHMQMMRHRRARYAVPASADLRADASGLRQWFASVSAATSNSSRWITALLVSGEVGDRRRQE